MALGSNVNIRVFPLRRPILRKRRGKKKKMLIPAVRPCCSTQSASQVPVPACALQKETAANRRRGESRVASLVDGNVRIQSAHRRSRKRTRKAKRLHSEIAVVASYLSSYSSCLTHQHTRPLATGVLTAILLIDIMVVASYSSRLTCYRPRRVSSLPSSPPPRHGVRHGHQSTRHSPSYSSSFSSPPSPPSYSSRLTRYRTRHVLLHNFPLLS